MNRLFRWLIMVIAIGVPVQAGAESMRVLKGHVLQQLQQATRGERVSAAETVDLGLVVQLDQALMDRTFEEIYGRNGKGSRRFLSSAEFARKFGVAEKRETLKAFARANGLAVNAVEDRAESMVVKVSGRADAVERAFRVQLNRYRQANGQTFRAHDTDPMVPASIASNVSAILGLSNLKQVARPHHRIARQITGAKTRTQVPAAAPRFTGTGPGFSVAPSDIKTVYGLNSTTMDGSGQTVAIFELDGYNPADIAAYETQFGLAHVPLTFVGVDGMTNLCGDDFIGFIDCTLQDPNVDGGMVEVALDIELVIAVAPGATRIMVYDGPNSYSGVTDTYDRIATDNLAGAVSTSWGLYELAAGSAFSTGEAPIFQRMAIQGQALFAASGDNGSLDNGFSTSVDDPASQPYVTGVGGTTLTGTPGSVSETAWNGSGGGVSAIWAIPGYQGGLSGAASNSFRNVPDVSLNADPNSGYAVYVGGTWFQVGGTSAAAPLWAAFMTLVNQQRAAEGNSVLGFANPSLYQVGTSSVYSSLFNDISSGNNGGFTAHANYDNVTGLGSYKGGSLILALESAVNFATLYNLSSVYAYPNPWDTRRHATRQMTFANLPPGGNLKIFTLSGFLVKTLSVGSDQAVWDLSNDSGRPVASGVYIYLATNADESNTMVGKVAIIK